MVLGVSMDRDTRVWGEKNRVTWFTCFFLDGETTRGKTLWLGWGGGT